MYSSSQDLSRNGYFVSYKLSTCYNLFRLSRFPVSFRYIDITITPHTNRKMSQATSHCLKYIFPFSTVVGKKIYLNIFSPPKIRWRKYIQIYFLPPKYGGENIFKYIFSQKNTVVKIYLNIFSPKKIRW